MKKLFALLLALMMVLSLAACGGGDDKPSGNEDNPPSSGQQQEQNTPDPDDGEDNGSETFEWPSVASEIEWTGSGKIICVEEIGTSSNGDVEIYIDKATLEEVGEYIQKVKDFGIDCSDEPESALEFNDNGIFLWAGLENWFQIALWQEEGPGRGYVDGSYQLKIVVPTEAGIFK